VPLSPLTPLLPAPLPPPPPLPPPGLQGLSRKAQKPASRKSHSPWTNSQKSNAGGNRPGSWIPEEHGWAVKADDPRKGQPRCLDSGSISRGWIAAQKAGNKLNEVGFPLDLIGARSPEHLSVLLASLWALPTHKRRVSLEGGDPSLSARQTLVLSQEGEGVSSLVKLQRRWTQG
jgi:hypothetical protein